MDAAEKERIPNDADRRKIINFMIARFKVYLPKGIESVSQDSFKKIATKIGLEYAHQTEPEMSSMKKQTLKWSPEVEHELRVGFSQGYMSKGPEDFKQKCDCVIGKLKKMYPDSITIPLSDQTMEKVLGDCF